MTEPPSADEVKTLVFTGKITRGAGDVEMRERFKAALSEHAKGYVFDLREVPFVDSAAVGEMVACFKRARQRQAELKLLLVRGGRPEELLRLASLDRVFEVYHDEGRAIESFNE